MRRNLGGFTILEVMIFLIISSAMLVAVMVAVTGQQNRTQFMQAMRDIDSKLQDTINDVSTGNFSYNDKNCTIVSGRPYLDPTSSGTAIGSRSDCLFLGVALQFSTQDASGSKISEDRSFAIYTVLGRRLVPGSATSPPSPVDSIAVAMPTSFKELTTFYKFKSAITTKDISYNGTHNTYTLLGIYTSFRSAPDNTGNGSADAAQSLQPYIYKFTDGARYNSLIDPSAINCISSASCLFDTTLSNGGNQGWGLCFDSVNTPGQTALITVYSTSQGISTRLEFNPTGVPQC